MARQYGALSGLAILLIVLNHSIEFAMSAPGVSTGDWQSNVLTTLKALGIFAVPTFLFISGSFVAYAAQGERPSLSRKFMLSTLRHIIIPYLIWSVVFYILIYFVNDDRYTLAGYLKNLIVGYPFHFVPLLVFYYILSPLLVRVGKSFYGILMLVVIGLFQLALINLLNPGYLGFTFPASARILAVPVLRSTLADWAIYFPLGVVCSLGARKFVPWARKLKWVFAGLTLLLFVLSFMNAFSIVSAPLARFLSPLPFVLLLPGIKRDSIPLVRLLERVGRRSYGIYLTHLIVLSLLFLALTPILTWLSQFTILASALFFFIGFGIPLLLMESVAKGPAKRMYRYIFG
jgi:probable poly-beta-1,6-N-acetyl-D-glucosamine export protein